MVIPAYNERDRLPAALEDALAYLRDTRRSWEVIVVDDGSTDGTASLIEGLHSQERRVRILRSASNMGKGAAIAAGALHARGERLLLMDADGGVPLSALPQLERTLEAEVLKHGRCGLVVGERCNSRPWYRRLMGGVFRGLAATCISSIVDTQCGFKLLSREAARETLPHLHVRRWAYDVELIYLAQRLDLGVVSAFVPSADVPGSKIRWHTPVQMLCDVLRISVLYRVGLWSLPKPSDTRVAGTAARVSCYQEWVRKRR